MEAPKADPAVSAPAFDDHLSDTRAHTEARGAMTATRQHDSGAAHFSTLNEPVSQTFLRDLRAVAAKFANVLWPFSGGTALLRQWDLWGPLILCTVLAVSLGDGGGGPQFAEVFVVVWLGSAVVTLNTKLLGGAVSFFQSVCVLGYCLLPTVAALFGCRAVQLVASRWSGGTGPFLLRLLLAAAGFSWSLVAAASFLGHQHPADRRALGVYPIALFYFIVSWMILSHGGS